MIDRALVESKLDRLKQYLGELKPYAGMTFSEYMSSNEHYRTAERLMQLVVDTAMEINSHLLVESGKSAPDDYYSSFTQLAPLKALDAALAKRLAASTGLRNRLVHDYADVDFKIVFQSIRDALRDYRAYSTKILAFME